MEPRYRTAELLFFSPPEVFRYSDPLFAPDGKFAVRAIAMIVEDFEHKPEYFFLHNGGYWGTSPYDGREYRGYFDSPEAANLARSSHSIMRHRFYRDDMQLEDALKLAA